MTKRYLIDTAIWIDLYEDRVGYNGEPLGEYAWKLILHIQQSNSRIVLTNTIVQELERYYTLEQINGLFNPFKAFIDTIITSSDQVTEAEYVAQERLVPNGDALHAIVARDNRLLLVTRDRHFRLLNDIERHSRPEQII